MKKNSTKMKLLSAAGMLAISAAMLATSTYAWFTMNTEVSVEGLSVNAKAEDGLLIGAYTSNGTVAPVATAFSDSADAYNTLLSSDPSIALYPTFTVDATTWYHQTSRSVTDGQDYAETAAVTVTNGADDKYYYELNKFQIKATGDASIPVYVKDVSIASRTQEAYDPSLRVLIKTSDHTLIFGRNGTETGTFKLLDSDTINKSYTLTSENTAGAKIIDAATTTAKDVDIYLYYDGEDPACKTENIVDFTAITVNVDFTSVTPT